MAKRKPQTNNTNSTKHFLLCINGPPNRNRTTGSVAEARETSNRIVDAELSRRVGYRRLVDGGIVVRVAKGKWRKAKGKARKDVLTPSAFRPAPLAGFLQIRNPK